MPRGGLDAIFSPSSIAIVGASRHRGKIGYEILHNLILNEYQGTIYPVNPKATSIHGIRAYPSVLEIPGPGSRGRSGRHGSRGCSSPSDSPDKSSPGTRS